MYRELGEAAWAWVLGQVRDDNGPWLPEVVADDGPPAAPGDERDAVYGGIGGLALVLAEIRQSRPLGGAEQAVAAGIAARLSAAVPSRADASLYSGLGGDVTALKLLAPGSEQVALARLAALMTPAGWDTPLQMGTGSALPANDLVLGTAGVVLAAIWAGGEDARAIATTGGEALLRQADRTAGGLDWAMQPGRPGRRMPNYSHGTAGVAAALAMAGAELGRDDFIAAAAQGARHLLAVGSLEGDGFIVPRTLPDTRPDLEEMTYTWCHGPAGTSYLFAALAHARVDSLAGFGVTRLRQRCLNSILGSAVPQRLRPGFWDNDGRCCGTAGVGDVLLDAAQDCTDPEAAGRCCRGRASWQTPSPSAPSAMKPGRGGASWSTARTRHCSRPVPRGCRAPRESQPSSSAWPGSARTGWVPPSSTAQTSGGPSPPGSVPSTPGGTSPKPGPSPSGTARTAIPAAAAAWLISGDRSVQQEPDPPQPGDELIKCGLRAPRLALAHQTAQPGIACGGTERDHTPATSSLPYPVWLSSRPSWGDLTRVARK